MGDISHHETLRKIRALNDDELEQLALVATHEGLSVEQEVLLLLAFNSFESSTKQEAEQQVRATRTKFESLGLINITGDTFEVEGSGWAKVYLSYRYLKQIGKPYSLSRSSQASYPNLLINKLKNNLMEAVIAADDSLIPLFKIRKVTVDTGLNGQIDGLMEQVDRGEATRLSRSMFLIPIMLNYLLDDEERKPLVLSRFYFSCSEPDGEVFLEFFAPQFDVENGQSDSNTIVTEAVEGLRDVFHLYGLSLDKTEQRTLSQSYVKKFVDLLKARDEIHRIGSRFYSAYGRREFELAEQLANEALEIAKSMSENHRLSWLISRCFMQICNGYEDEALPSLKEIASRDVKDEHELLAKMDLTYIDLEKGDFQQAETTLREIIGRVGKNPPANDTYLKLSFGPNDPLCPLNNNPNYNLVDDANMRAIAECMLAIIEAKNDNFELALTHVQEARRIAKNRSYPRRVEARIHM